MPDPQSILIVEDEDLIRDTYARRLEHEGYTVQQASTGRDALRVARQSLPRLILLDVMLPDLSGLEVLKSLRADRRFLTTPVVLFTNLSQHMDKHQAARLGATDYLVKSEVAPADVVARVRQLLAADPGQRLLLQLDGDFSDPWSRSFRVRLRCAACRETHDAGPDANHNPPPA